MLTPTTWMGLPPSGELSERREIFTQDKNGGPRKLSMSLVQGRPTLNGRFGPNLLGCPLGSEVGGSSATGSGVMIHSERSHHELQIYRNSRVH